MELSVVLPVFNEEGSLDTLLTELEPIVARADDRADVLEIGRRADLNGHDQVSHAEIVHAPERPVS